MATKPHKTRSSSPRSQTPRDLFVVMPFSGTKSCTEAQWTDIFDNVFMPAAKKANLSCSRARVSTGSLIKSIVERLRTSYIVLADITDANPNVFYELGVRHSLSKRTVIVAQGASHIPSDLRGYWSLIYGTQPGQVKSFAKELSDIVKQIDLEPERPDSPVGEYLEHEFQASSRQANTDIARKLSALHTELTGMLVELGRTQLNPASNSLTDHACLSLLLDTRYLDPGAETLAIAYEGRDLLRQIAAAGLQTRLVVQARRLITVLGVRIDQIRQKVAIGTYQQPEQLSVMEWALPPSKYAGSGPACRVNLTLRDQDDFWMLCGVLEEGERKETSDAILPYVCPSCDGQIVASGSEAVCARCEQRFSLPPPEKPAS